MKHIIAKKVKSSEDAKDLESRVCWFKDSRGIVLIAIKEMDGHGSLEKHIIDIDGHVCPSVLVKGYKGSKYVEFHEFIILEDWKNEKQ